MSKNLKSGTARQVLASITRVVSAAHPRANEITPEHRLEPHPRREPKNSRSLSQLHYAFKTPAYTLINLRHFCIG